MEYPCKLKTKSTRLKFCRVDVLQELHIVIEIMMSTYSLPDLYLTKMKNALFFAPESNGLLVLVLCNVHIRSHPLNEKEEQVTLLEGEKLWFYLLNGEGLEPIVLPWKCHSGHTMELCDECNNCTKSSEEVFRDIPFLWFYIIFLSAMWRHNLSNLHKSKSWITRQPRVLSQ